MRYGTIGGARHVCQRCCRKRPPALCPAIILDGAPNIRVPLAVAPIAASSPLSSAGTNRERHRWILRA